MPKKQKPLHINLLSITLLIFCGCAHNHLSHEYTITRFDTIIASSMEKECLMKKPSSNVVNSSFKFSIKNTGTNPVIIDGAKSTLTFRTSNVAINCSKATDNNSSFSLQQNATAYMQCAIDLKSDEQNQLANQDTSALINLPYEIGTEKKLINFKIYFKAEDFQ